MKVNINHTDALNTLLALFFLCFFSSGYAQTPIVISFDNPSTVPTSCFTPFTEEGISQQLVNNSNSCFFDYSTANNGRLWLFPATLSVDLTGLGSIEKVEVDHTDFCGTGCSQAALLSGGIPVLSAANTTVGSQETMILDNISLLPVDELTISSFEGLFLEIRIFPAASDPCNGTGDSDNDGICDALDTCPGFDDNIDRDGNGIPDYCDICEINRIMMEPSLSGDMLTYEAIGQISSMQAINSGATVRFNAGALVELGVGFEVQPNAEFVAETDGCFPPTNR